LTLFGRTFALFDKLGCFTDSKNLYSFQSSTIPDMMAADLITYSVSNLFCHARL